MLLFDGAARLDEIEHLLDRLRLADDAVEPEAAVELLLERAVLGLELAPLEALADGEADLLVLERLRDVVEGALLHGVDGALDRRERGDHHHHQVGVVLADLPEDLHAGEAGQHEVEQDEVDLLALEQGQRLLAGARHDRLVALLAHQRGEDVLEDLLVVDDEDAHAADLRAGRSRTTKRQPGPSGRSSIASSPPWRRTISWLIDRPRPVPPARCLVE